MNVMLVAIAQRTDEIGLLKALGASGRTIRHAFLAEAALLSLGGAAAGILLGHAGAWALRLLYPLLPAWPPDWAVLAGSVPRSSPDFCSGCCRLAALRRSIRCTPWRSASAMIVRDVLSLSLSAITAHRMRSFLTLLGIAIGIAAVILLTSIGEGIHRFVLAEFSQFGTNVIGITAVARALAAVRRGCRTPAESSPSRTPPRCSACRGDRGHPGGVGNSEVEALGRVRRTTIYGVGSAMQKVFAMQVRSGRFLPPDDPASARAFAVLGAKLKHELFGTANPLGQRIRIGGERYRVIGVMEEKGQFLGTDLDDTAYIPTGRAMALYNRSGLLEIDVSYREGIASGEVASAIRSRLSARHGREDFTLTTQEDMLRTLSKILDILTAAVGALGGISLLVGGVGIVTIMTIAVSERTAEIGLLVALGARRSNILLLFLGEAIALAAAGGVFGLLLGGAVAAAIRLALPSLPVHALAVRIRRRGLRGAHRPRRRGAAGAAGGKPGPGRGIAHGGR